MSSLVFRKFTHFAALKSCGVDLLQRFLTKAVSAEESAQIALPGMGTGEKADDEYYRALIALFRETEHLPDGLCEILYRIDALASAETADRLTEICERNSIPLQNTTDPTETEVAMQLWLARPDVFDTEYDAQKLQSLRTFTHFLSEEPGPKEFKKPTTKQLAGMANKLKPWFKRYGRGEDVWITDSEIDGEWWFIIDHGERISRTGRIEKGQRQVFRYRPDKDDVLVYNPETNAIRACAGTIGVKRQFRDTFGETFFDSKDYFAKEEVYRFEPLYEDPDKVLDCEDVEGIDSVRLVELKYSGNRGFKEVVTRRSSDILAMYKERKEPQKLPNAENIHRVSFEVVFSGNDKKPRPVKITSRSTIQIARDCDHRVVHAWLRLKKMEIQSGE